MPIKAVQQFMLGTVMNKETQAVETMRRMKEAGYNGIELCGFMIHPSGMMVKLMTRAAGMPVGNGGKLDWHRLVRDSGLRVVSIHQDLGSVERDPAAVAQEAKGFDTDKIVITGMYRYAYGDREAVRELARRLNKAGDALKKRELSCSITTTTANSCRWLPDRAPTSFCWRKQTRMWWALNLTAIGVPNAAPIRWR